MPMVINEIDKLSAREKVEVMEYLWSALEGGDDYTPPAWHARELARREALYKEGKIPAYDWAEVRERLAARRCA